MRRWLLVGAALAFLAACTDDTVTSTPSYTLPGPASGTPTDDPTATFRLNLTPATVTRVVDGDTIVVDIDGSEYKLRYIGINTPEVVDPRRPVECFGQEARDYNEELVLGRTVGLEKDVSETDQFGRLLRYVWLGDEMVNATLVREGYAQASAYPPDVRYQDLLSSLQAEAAGEGRGLWGEACQTTASLAPLAGAPGGCEYSGTAERVIKGNISVSSGEKIYHVPGGEFYEITVISEGKGERWFCTEAEAVAAGWRKSKG